MGSNVCEVIILFRKLMRMSVKSVVVGMAEYFVEMKTLIAGVYNYQTNLW
jgi:hypothetical protein